MGRHTTKQIMKEYIDLASLSTIYGRTTYEAGTCPKCGGEIKDMGGYEKCEECGERKPR